MSFNRVLHSSARTHTHTHTSTFHLLEQHYTLEFEFAAPLMFSGTNLCKLDADSAKARKSQTKPEIHDIPCSFGETGAHAVFIMGGSVSGKEVNR